MERNGREGKIENEKKLKEIERNRIRFLKQVDEKGSKKCILITSHVKFIINKMGICKEIE